MILSIGCDKESDMKPVIKHWFNIEVIKGKVNIMYDNDGYDLTQPLEPGLKPVFNPENIPTTIRTFCIDKVCEYEVNGKTFYDHSIFYYEDFQ